MKNTGGNDIIVGGQFLFNQGILYMERIRGRIPDSFILDCVNHILPLSLLYDKIHLPARTFNDLSSAFKKDLETCLGVSFYDISDQHEEIIGEDALFDIFRTHQSLLYNISGSYAAAFSDTKPAIYSIAKLMRLSEKLKAPVNTSEKHINLYQDIAKKKTLFENKQQEVLDCIFQAHEMPIISNNTFREKNGKINLTLLFETMEKLRKDPNLNSFRNMVVSFLEEGDLIEKNVSKKSISDFEMLFDYCFHSSGGEKGELATGIISDLIGIVVPGTSTVKTLYDLKRKRALKEKLSWHMFIYSYGKSVQEK